MRLIMKMVLIVTIGVTATATSAGATEHSDVSVVSFPNSGAAAAQPSFLRGLALLHNFEYGAAADAFREAQSQDPVLALAYWGEAMTFNDPIHAPLGLRAARTYAQVAPAAAHAQHMTSHIFYTCTTPRRTYVTLEGEQRKVMADQIATVAKERLRSRIGQETASPVCATAGGAHRPYRTPRTSAQMPQSSLALTSPLR